MAPAQTAFRLHSAMSGSRRWYAVVPRIAAPGHEAIGNAAACQQMPRLIPGSELRVYEGAHHPVADCLGDRCARHAPDFLRRRFGGRAAGPGGVSSR